ncbi:NADP-dependent oxidoreductase [Streptomyces triticirhizae]|uniref:NADP-dependent oxidoreductase n=1 Tax=Streptomyces triticirhizae TaxID=2483353 RepID=A0A3M2M688_9ACTN|nr:NADP-dependent oxidoreductase [Streptomyces triticirhizae]RMI45207.1 NADP-dependent oxidoreductase [Streptomyces triticirhizae]
MPETMTAAVATSPGEIRLTEVDRPAPWLGEVLVQVRAAGINPADCRAAAGRGLPVEHPFPLGWEMAGVVRAVGPMVTRFAPGDEVLGLLRFPRPGGCHAEFVTAPTRQLALRPAALSPEAAAALPLAGLTAWQALTEVARVEAGQRVLVTAAGGGVGHLAVRLARRLGATVIATASEGKHALVRGWGADEVIDHTRKDPATEVADVDVVLDLLGGRETERLLGTPRPGGVLVRVAGGDPAPFAGADGRRGVPMLVEPDHAALAELASLAAGGEVEVLVERTWPLAELPAAYAAVEAGHAVGKTVLTVDACELPAG